jgi:hypothetical protein
MANTFEIQSVGCTFKTDIALKLTKEATRLRWDKDEPLEADKATPANYLMQHGVPP